MSALPLPLSFTTTTPITKIRRTLRQFFLACAIFAGRIRPKPASREIPIRGVRRRAIFPFRMSANIRKFRRRKSDDARSLPFRAVDLRLSHRLEKKGGLCFFLDPRLALFLLFLAQPPSHTGRYGHHTYARVVRGREANHERGPRVVTVPPVVPPPSHTPPWVVCIFLNPSVIPPKVCVPTLFTFPCFASVSLFLSPRFGNACFATHNIVTYFRELLFL
jgi:hypothetical protein